MSQKQPAPTHIQFDNSGKYRQIPRLAWRLANLGSCSRIAHYPKEFLEGRFTVVKNRFLRPFSPALWQTCQEYTTWREATLEKINQEYKRLQRKPRKKKGQQS